MRKKKLKPEEVKSILLIYPHLISMEDVLKVCRELKSQFPSAKITFTGNKENLNNYKITLLKNFIEKLIIYDKKEISIFKYITKLRKRCFDLVIIPSFSNSNISTKILLLLFLIRTKQKVLFLVEKNRKKEFGVRKCTLSGRYQYFLISIKILKFF